MILLLSTTLAGVSTRDLVPCEGPPNHLEGTRFDLMVHTEVLVDGVIARQRTAEETWVLDASTPWPDALHGLSEGCRRELDVPAENAATAGLTEQNPGGAVRMVLDVKTIETPERKPPAQPREVPTVLRTASNLGYFDFVVGNGPRPQPGQRAVVEYTLWLADSNVVIDSSYKRAEPFGYLVGRGQVIAGWEEGVQGMRVGGERQLHVPWKQGYGRRGSPPSIPEKADLVFEVKLLRVE